MKPQLYEETMTNSSFTNPVEGKTYVFETFESLRDKFAAHALIGLMASPVYDMDATANRAFQMANAMLIARGRR